MFNRNNWISRKKKMLILFISHYNYFFFHSFTLLNTFYLSINYALCSVNMPWKYSYIEEWLQDVITKEIKWNMKYGTMAQQEWLSWWSSILCTKRLHIWFWSGRIPGSWVWSLVRASVEGNWSMFLYFSLTSMFLSLPLFLSLNMFSGY